MVGETVDVTQSDNDRLPSIDASNVVIDRANSFLCNEHLFAYLCSDDLQAYCFLFGSDAQHLWKVCL